MTRTGAGLLNRRMLSACFAVSALAAGSVHAQVASAPDPKPGTRLEVDVIDKWSGKVKVHWVMTCVGRSGAYVRQHVIKTDLTKPEMKPIETDITVLASLNQRLPYRNEYRETLSYNWPLVPGKTWSYSQNTEVPAGNTSAKMDVEGSTDAEVKDWETVEVPAGKFKAIKVVLNQVIKASSVSMHQTSTYWYTPDIPYPIKTVSERTNPDGSPGEATIEQLVSYSLP